jgi:predicted RecA/RadA family phage recombinase
MNTLKSIGTKVIGAMIATGLVAGAAFAATGSTVTVTLPQSVSVGSAVLASGEYKVTEFAMNDGSSLFVFRSDKGEATSALAMKSADPAVDQKTEIVLSNQGGSLHLDKMFIAGEASGYQFAESK